jgi:hypothetical protein
MKLLIAIVPRSMIDEVSSIIGSGRLDYQTTMLGSGTATSEILDYFSLAEVERSVLFSMVDDIDIPLIFRRLTEELDFLRSGMGVAFTIALDAISKLGYQKLYEIASEVSPYGKQ